MEPKNLIIFEALTAFISAHSLLATANTPDQTQVFFYIALLCLNWISLVLIYLHYTKDHAELEFIPYLSNITQKGWALILLGVAVSWILAAVLSSPWTSSVIHVPLFSMGTDISFTVIMTAMLSNFALIANSEETTKLVGHNALYLYLYFKYPNHKKEIQTVSAVVPIGFWAVLHAYIAYTGALVWQLVLAAFVVGIVIFAVLWKTKSLLAAIIIHGTYNVIIVTVVALQWATLLINPIPLFCYALFNVILLILARRNRIGHLHHT